MRKCDDCYCCDCNDPNIRCTMLSIDRSYACPLYTDLEDDRLTVKDLIEILSKYPPDMSMQVAVGSFISEVAKVDKCVDMDTNKVSLVVYGQDRNHIKDNFLKLPCKPKDIVYFIGCNFSKCSVYGEEYDEASCQRL